MTTHFDKTRRPTGTAPPNDPEASLCREGVSDLAALALAQLAAGAMEAELSADAMAALPIPQITAMARAMADSESGEAEAMVAELMESGLSVRDLCLAYLTPAARELGRLWECDTLPFTEVSMATARMQAILRNLPGTGRLGISGGAQGALFASAPGETHTLGVLIAADQFRRLGWDVSALVGLGYDALRRRILADDRPILGLSCAGAHSVKNLARLIQEVQARRPALAILVSGAVTQDPDAMALLPDCDGIIEDLETADAGFEVALAKAQSRNGHREKGTVPR